MEKRNTKLIGDIAQLTVILEFTKRGYQVSSPYGDNAPYDLIIDYEGSLKKVQVKGRSRLKNKPDTIDVPVVQSKNCITKELYHYAGKVDWILLVDLTDFKIYKIDSDDFCKIKKSFYLRIEGEAKNKGGNYELGRHGKDYLMFGDISPRPDKT